MLELAAAAVIVHVVRARRRDATGAGLDDFAKFRAREIAVPVQRSLTQPNAIARRRARHEDDAAVAQSADALPSDCYARDRHDIAHSRPSRSASRRAACVHAFDCGGRAVKLLGGGRSCPWSATIAAATANAIKRMDASRSTAA